ncbi:MAG: ATP synthase F1 subunit epsilon [SAR324 cluster bacterium]|nr:ATP synthase F1 subunit epsilon [SAR324 cluster bacterium]
MGKLSLEVVTPQRVVLQTEADYVTIPGQVGELGILPGHLPVLTSMSSGVLSFVNGTKNTKIALHYGFAQVHNDKITLLAKMAEDGSDMDMERCRDAREKAQAELRTLGKDADEALVTKLEGKVRRANTRVDAGKISVG